MASNNPKPFAERILASQNAIATVVATERTLKILLRRRSVETSCVWVGVVAARDDLVASGASAMVGSSDNESTFVGPARP